jgi:hypothetical protein
MEDRLPQRIAIGLLTKVFPPNLVDDVVDRAGARGQRERELSARLTVYFALALWLFVRSGYEYVMACVMDGMVWARRSPGGRRVPRASSLARARDRLGPDVLHLLFERVAGPVGTPETRGAFWRERRVLSLDGTTLDVPDTPDNVHTWGRPADQASSRLPQVRLLALAECGTQAVIDATFGPYTMGEEQLTRRLLRHFGPETVLLADLRPLDNELWADAVGTGADLVWRVPSDLPLPVRHTLIDGTYLSHLGSGAEPMDERLAVRVIRYTIIDDGEALTLITTLTDPVQAPWIELALLYPERWRLSTAIEALAAERNGAGKLTLRSRTPDGIVQEIWAMFCVHHAIRDLIGHPATFANGIGPDRIRFNTT